MRKIKKFNLSYRKKSSFFCMAFFLLSNLIIAQGIVQGIVSSSEGLPLPGVNILEKGTSNGVVSDFDGNYTLTVGDNAILLFSYLGYSTQEINVGNQTTINVVLVEDVQSLSEVIVIGYGTQLKEDLSGSVSSIDADELNDIPQVSVDQLMQGRASGVTVTQNSGQPGSAVSVRIRGIATISGSSEPLYIIDGVPISGDSNNIGTSGRSLADNGLGEDTGSTGVSPLASLNPSDIESINVLKDASATAIYGSRGANGVVIITTKSGRGKKGKLTFDTNLTIQRPTNFIDVMNLQQYARLQNEIGEIYGLEQQVEFLNPNLLGSGTNWQQQIFDDAIMSSHQVSYAKGGDKVNYFLSAGYLDQEGTVIGSGFDRTSFKANIDASITDKIKVGVNVTASRTNDQITLNSSSNGVVYLSLLNNPATAVFNPDGSFAGPVTEEEIAFGLRNPIAEALSIKNELRRDKLFGNVYGEIELGEHFKFRSEFGADFGENLSDRFQPAFSYGAIERGLTQSSIREEETRFWILKNLLTYNNTFNDKHKLTVLLGQEAQESEWEGKVKEVNDGVPFSPPAYKGSTALLSFFSRVIYSLNNKYNVTASIRADGSSKFADGNKWGYFPSISASWNVSNEEFMNDFEAIQNIKLFGGYGEVGNQNIPNFAYGVRLNPIFTGFDETDISGYEYANFGSEDLVWESSQQTNLGLDFSLFDSRFNTTIEVYNKDSKDFLYQFAASDFISGGNSPGAIAAPWINLGKIRNRGIDVSLNYKTKGDRDFYWNSNLTVSHYKNEVLELFEGLTPRGELTIDSSNQNLTITEVGQPIGMFYGYQVEGMFRTVDDFEGAPIQFGRPFEDALFATTWLGDLKFKDVNGDGVVNSDDRTIIGNPHPDFTFGFTNSFRYKNIDLSIFMQGSYGNDIFNVVDRALTAGNRTYTNQSPSILDYWSVDNPNASSPRLARNDTPNINISDRYVEDGSYLRIQNVTLGYSLPDNLINKLKMSKLRLYGSIQNLWTFTDYSGYDPEVGVYNQNALLTGVDNGRYPTPRMFTIGLNAEF